MCYRVDCKQCGKYSWGGCGRHLATVYAGIESGKHCMCRPWPGLDIPSPTPTPTTTLTPRTRTLTPSQQTSGSSTSTTTGKIKI